VTEVGSAAGETCPTLIVARTNFLSVRTLIDVRSVIGVPPSPVASSAEAERFLGALPSGLLAAFPFTVTLPPASETLPARSTGRLVASGVGVKLP
jgi:hypothetical protein